MAFSVGAPTGSISAAGRIPCAGQLQVAGPNGLGSSWPAGSARILVQPGESGGMSVALVVRSNCPYRIDAELAGASEDKHIELSAPDVTPYGGTGHLMRGALQARQESSVVTSVRSALWSGPAVSRGGNNRTTDNAVQLRSRVIAAPNANGVEVIFTLSFDPSP